MKKINGSNAAKKAKAQVGDSELRARIAALEKQVASLEEGARKSTQQATADRAAQAEREWEESLNTCGLCKKYKVPHNDTDLCVTCASALNAGTSQNRYGGGGWGW